VSCSFQNWNSVCGQSRKVSKDGAMEDDEGFGLWIWGMLEVIDVAVWAETTDDGGTWRGGKPSLAMPRRRPAAEHLGFLPALIAKYRRKRDLQKMFQQCSCILLIMEYVALVLVADRLAQVSSLLRVPHWRLPPGPSAIWGGNIQRRTSNGSFAPTLGDGGVKAIAWPALRGGLGAKAR
jgi:hypothetical protein